MKVLRVISAAIIVTLLVCHAIEAFSTTALGMERGGPYRLKRSLCNTFGGCGAKRSPIQQHPDFSDTIAGDQAKFELRNGRGTSAELFAEILADLTNYLQRKEDDKTGKYVIAFTKQPDGSLKQAIISTSPNIQPSDPVDAQLGQLSFAKNN